MKKIPNTVTPSIPENTAVPKACRISAPAPVPSTSGTTPRMKASDVIRIGRSRSFAASSTASAAVAPASCRCLANSTIRIAFLAARPIRTTRPICVKMLLSRPASQTPAIAAKRHIGTIRMIASGSAQLSYWAAKTKNTNTVPSANTSVAVLPAKICWSESSVQAMSMPGGMAPCPTGGWAASDSRMAIASPELVPGSVPPESSAEG